MWPEEYMGHQDQCAQMCICWREMAGTFRGMMQVCYSRLNNIKMVQNRQTLYGIWAIRVIGPT